MIVYVIEGSQTGLYSALYYAYKNKKFPDKIIEIYTQLSLTDEIIYIKNDTTIAEKVKIFLTKCKTKNTVYETSIALKSGECNKLSVIFFYLKTVIDEKNTDISRNFAHTYVLNFYDLIKRIHTETHRFKGFLRFEESSSGFYYSHYTPDNDITEYLMPHFEARFASIPFIIHDVKRNIVGLCDGKTYKTIYSGNTPVTIYLSDNETVFRNLWRSYYNAVTIKCRKNDRQMYAYMPKRYHKDLPEKNGLPR